MAEVKVPKKRRLTDLYAKGKYVTLNDDSGEMTPVRVWLSKITDLESKTAIEKSSTARVRHLLMQKDYDHEGRALYIEQLNQLDGLDKRTLTNIIIAPKMEEQVQSIEARIAAEDEWANDGYLESLREAWNDGLLEAYEKDPEDSDAKRVFDELYRFAEQVEEEAQAVKKDMLESYSDRPFEALMNLAVDRLIDIDGTTVWMDEFNRWRVFYAVKDEDNHRERYFESRDEVDLLDSNIFNRLVDEYDNLVVPTQEGKD